MGFKKYIIASFAFLLIIAAYVYSIDSGLFTVKIDGRVSLGDRCFVSAGAVIIDKVTICDDVIIGAGTIVIKDITEKGTYVGNPARKIK